MLRRHRDLEIIKAERCLQKGDIGRTHSWTDAQRCIHYQTKATHASPEMHNNKTSLLTVNIDFGDYIMVRTSANPSPRSKVIWRGLVKVVESISSLMFTVEKILTHQHHVVHAQLAIPYPVISLAEQTLNELKEQAVRYDASYHLVQDSRSVRKRTLEYERLECWLGFEEAKD